MPADVPLREGHACLARDCGHPPAEHVRTPELAGPEETVVWCSSCRRHETRGARRWTHLFGGPARRHRRRLGGAV